MSPAVIVFRRPPAVLVRWETPVLLEFTCGKAELPGSVFFQPEMFGDAQDRLWRAS